MHGDVLVEGLATVHGDMTVDGSLTVDGDVNLGGGPDDEVVVSVALGRIVAFYHRPSASYQTHEQNRSLCC